MIGRVIVGNYSKHLMRILLSNNFCAEFMKNTFIINNFDLLRLFAACQVVIMHGVHHLDIDVSGWWIISFLKIFPGVPIFFFISGFLISKSYINNNDIKRYAGNRIFRIYPALFVCTAITIVGVFLTGYFENKQISTINFISWVIAQVSFFQFYNPDFMRQFGTGVLNGSLWTITVELQFYFIVPVLYWIIRYLSSFVKNSTNYTLVFLTIIFIIINRTYIYFTPIYSDNTLFKVVGVSFFPWFYMFLVGVFFQHNYDYIVKFLKNKLVFVLSLYVFMSWFLVRYFSFNFGNEIGPLLFFMLVFTVFSAAYTMPSISKSLLNNNDYSYGIYIYHIPVINFFMYFELDGNLLSLFAVMLLTFALAILSWYLIEKPSLLFKKKSIRSLP